MPTLSNRARVLLTFSKRSQEAWTWTAVAKALGPTFGHELGLMDVVRVAVDVYREVLRDGRFELGSEDAGMSSLVLAPVKGFRSVLLIGRSSNDTRCSVGSFYEAMLVHILGELRVSRVDWMGQEALDGMKSAALEGQEG